MSDPVKTSDTTRTARLEARLPSDQKELFQRAAALAGQTLSEFVIDSAQQAAAKLVQDHDLIRLAREEQIAFVTTLLRPTEPGERLRQAAEKYREKSGL
jgi:uncharacterized protein (DUF1778 family)